MPATRPLLKRILVTALAGVVILAGLLVGGVRLVDHLMPRYRDALAERIGSRIDADIDIAAIELRWQWRGPLLALDDVAIRRHGQADPAVTLDRLDLHFSFSDLLEGGRLPDGLVIAGAELALQRTDDGRLRLRHWGAAGETATDWRRVEAARKMLRFVRVEGARIHLIGAAIPGGRATIDPFDARLRRAADGLRWNLEAGGPDWLGQVAARGRLEGALTDPVDADIQVDADGIDTLAIARARFGSAALEADRVSGGALSLSLRGRWRDRALADSSADIALSAIEADDRERPVLPGVEARLEAETGPTPGTIRMTATKLTADDGALTDARLTGTFARQSRRLELTARGLPLALALRPARLRFDRLADTRIDGRLDAFTLSLAPDTPPSLEAAFSGLTVDDPAGHAGPISGHYRQSGDVHRLRFDQAGGRLAVPRFMRGELAIDGLGGALAWQRADDGWTIEAEKLELTSGEADVGIDGRLRLPDEAAPRIDLIATASAPDATRLLARIPQAEDLPNQRLRDWLPRAITAGHLDAARLELAGPLDRFPFADPRADERFHLELEGHGVDVTYKPEWPPLEDARGTLTLDGDDLRVDVAEATMLGVALGPSVGRVADVREPILQVDGSVSDARAERMLAFLARSPLRERFGKLVEALQVSGPADLGLDLTIPLKPGLGEPEVAGHVDAHGAELQHAALPGPVTDIRGRIDFDAQGLTAEGLTGDLLGVAVRTDLEPRPGARQHIDSHARIALPADADALAHYLPRPWLDYAEGATALRVAFDVGRDGGPSDIHATGDLAGMALNLPAPMTKAAETPAPLDITIAGDGSRVDVAYDERLDIGVRLAGGRPTRVQARLNDPGLTPPDTDGVWIGGRADTVDGLGWFYLVRNLLTAAEEEATSTDDEATELAFIGGDLRAGELRVDNRYYENVHVRTRPMSDAPGWRVDLDGPDTRGQFTWTQPAGGRVAIDGDLARLAIHTRPPEPDDDHGDGPTPSPVIWPEVDPRELPGLTVDVASLWVDDTDFGRASLNAATRADGWQLERLALDDGALTGWATGRWTRADGRTRASAETRFEGHGLPGLFGTLGYPPTVRAERARVHAQLEIAPNPNGLDLRALDGGVNLALDNGTLLSVEPGAARVLGLVNLYVLPRRLQLDFRDVVDEGLAFDSIRAHFDIDDGNAYSDGVRIETPSSRIDIEGRIGLAARDYDERVTIVPKVGSGVAIASTVFGGPIVGAAVLAVQELLKQPIQKFSSIGYTLKGSWDDPQIAEPSAEQ